MDYLGRRWTIRDLSPLIPLISSDLALARQRAKNTLTTLSVIESQRASMLFRYPDYSPRSERTEENQGLTNRVRRLIRKTNTLFFVLEYLNGRGAFSEYMPDILFEYIDIK